MATFGRDSHSKGLERGNDEFDKLADQFDNLELITLKRINEKLA